MIYGASGDNIPTVAAVVQSSNLYAYCMNNPVMYNDFTGGGCNSR